MGEVTESIFVFNRRLNTVVQWASCRKACRGQSDSGAAQVGRIVQPVLRRRIGTSGVLPRDARFCSVLKINKIMQNPFADDKAQWISLVCCLLSSQPGPSWDSHLLPLLAGGGERGKALKDAACLTC